MQAKPPSALPIILTPTARCSCVPRVAPGFSPGARPEASAKPVARDLITEQLGVDEGTREYIRTSSFLHDIGKVALSDEDKERAQIRRVAEGVPGEEHPEIGAKLVQPLGFEERVAGAIRHHHEHWDGDGRPDGLRGEGIPLASRVIAVVDMFDKLTSDRLADPVLSAGEAAAELEKHAGSRLDPALVALFVAVLESGDFEFQADPAT